MTGMDLGPRPPHLTTDMLGAIVATLLAQTAGADDLALVLDSELERRRRAVLDLLPAAADQRRHRATCWRRSVWPSHGVTMMRADGRDRRLQRSG